MLLITQFLLTSLYNVFRFFAVMVWGYLGWLYMFYIILYLCHFQWNNKEDAVALKSLGQWMSFDSFCVPFKIINLMQTHFESFSLFIPIDGIQCVKNRYASAELELHVISSLQITLRIIDMICSNLCSYHIKLINIFALITSTIKWPQEKWFLGNKSIIIIKACIVLLQFINSCFLRYHIYFLIIE